MQNITVPKAIVKKIVPKKENPAPRIVKAPVDVHEDDVKAVKEINRPAQTQPNPKPQLHAEKIAPKAPEKKPTESKPSVPVKKSPIKNSTPKNESVKPKEPVKPKVVNTKVSQEDKEIEDLKARISKLSSEI